jgi:hypothetical protein
MLHVAHYAKKTPIPRTKTEPPNAFHVRLVAMPKKEVRNAPIAWPGNLKKPPARAKRYVRLVQPATTRIRRI